jgi:manganese transport protein
VTDTTAATPPLVTRQRWLKSIGPGLVTACVVIGPGSILTSSTVGAENGYSKVWVVVVAVFFMLVYTALAAKLGVVTGQSAGDLASQHGGRWLAVLIGIGVFFISAAFQFGNNLGVHAALYTYAKFDYWVVLFNAVAIAFVFGFRNLYRSVERLMAFLVALMLISFALNLGFARPDPKAFLAGLNPFSGSSKIGLPLLGLFGTTFVITAAYYQSYLVRFKGWKEGDLRDGLRDAGVGAVIMALITLMLMCTAAAVLGGKDLESVTDVADSLAPLFGEKGRAIFCLGLFAAAFSSFIVNSMIGGFILSDGLRLGSSPQEFVPRLLTVAVLLVGMFVALYVIRTGVKPVGAIVAAQAVTVVAAPLMAGALLWLTNLKSVMGKHRNGVLMNVAAGLGLVLLVLMAAYTAREKVWPAVYEALLK